MQHSSTARAGISAMPTLRTVYRKLGGKEAAENAIAELQDDTETLESWATSCFDAGERPFTFDELPAPSRNRARRMLAIAFLASTGSQS